MPHLALGIEYDGSPYKGWQTQKHVPSVQATLTDAVSQIACHVVQLNAAGRTDTGVHATGQVVSFATPSQRPLKAWLRGTNSHLPASIRVRWARAVDPRFHARYSASARRYLYVLQEADQLTPLLHNQVVLTDKLNDSAMHGAARALIGEHDFSSFRAAGCQSQSPFRCVHDLSVRRVQRFVIIDVTANAFLLHMVRNLSGVLLDVGLGRRDPASIPSLLAARDRKLAGKTAPPQGLYLVDIRYPEQAFPGADLPPVLSVLGGLNRL